MQTKAAKVTVSSLARELGLSTCTVSKILNRSFDGFTYAPETIRKVENAAKKQGYIPNFHARSLRTKRSMIIGLVVPSGIPYFSGTLVENIERELRPFGYETIVGHSISDHTAESRLVKAMISKGIDGLFWIPNGKKLRPDSFQLDASFPLVLLDRPGCSSKFPTVITDNTAASEELAKRIKLSGHSTITMLTSEKNDDSILERESGIRRVFGANIHKITWVNEIEAARQSIQPMLTNLEGTALVCLSQNLSLGALSALVEAQYNLGPDISFASFDDLPLCDIWNPKITRIQQNLDLLAAEAVRLLMEKIQLPNRQQPLEVRIPARLIWGTSVPTQKDEIAIADIISA